jgi:hypothetical protein
MRNNSSHKFTAIDSEEFRIYTVLNDTGIPYKIRIDQPTHLAVSASGGHRLLDAQGISHYVPAGWVHLCWKAKEGQPNFVA